MSNVATLGGHITVKNQAIIGGLAAVHQFCRVGRMAFIGGCSKVTQDVPPYMLADGNPAQVRTTDKVGLERNGVPEEAQAALRQAYKILFRDGLTHCPTPWPELKPNCRPCRNCAIWSEFVRLSERGISK